MGCGCGKRNTVRRQIRQVNPRVVQSANINSRPLTPQEKIAEERRVSEMRRRDHIFKLLNGKP